MGLRSLLEPFRLDPHRRFTGRQKTRKPFSLTVKSPNWELLSSECLTHGVRVDDHVG